MLDLSHLPQTDLGTVQCLNYLRLHQETATFEFDEGDAGLSVKILDTPMLHKALEPISILFYAPFGTLSLRLDPACIDLASDILLPGWQQEDPERLSIEWRAVYAFERVMQANGHGEMPLQIIDVIRTETPKSGPGVLDFRIEVGTKNFGAQLAMMEGDVNALSSLIQPPSFSALEKSNVEDIDVRFFPRVSGPTTSYGECQRLSPGDVLILPECDAGGFSLTMQIENGIAWQGRCDENGSFTLVRSEEVE